MQLGLFMQNIFLIIFLVFMISPVQMFGQTQKAADGHVLSNEEMNAKEKGPYRYGNAVYFKTSDGWTVTKDGISVTDSDEKLRKDGAIIVKYNQPFFYLSNGMIYSFGGHSTLLTEKQIQEAGGIIYIPRSQPPAVD